MKLSGVLGSCAVLGQSSYTGLMGLSMDRPAAYLLGVMPGTVKSNEAPVDLPTEQMLVIRRATVLSARMPLDLVMPF